MYIFGWLPVRLIVDPPQAKVLFICLQRRGVHLHAFFRLEIGHDPAILARKIIVHKQNLHEIPDGKSLTDLLMPHLADAAPKQ